MFVLRCAEDSKQQINGKCIDYRSYRAKCIKTSSEVDPWVGFSAIWWAMRELHHGLNVRL